MFFKATNQYVLIFIAGLMICMLSAAAYFYRPAIAPKLQSAVFIPKLKNLSDFSLKNHHGELFNNKDLIGRWSIILYGYTFCPDVCPTTLASLVRVKQLIQAEDPNDNMQMLFYTIDPQRDTLEKINQYLEFFQADFIGLSAYAIGGPLSFEKSLGIIYQLIPVKNEEPDIYLVAHAVVMYLLNPKGQLQAIFKPHISRSGVQSFNSDLVYSDYKTIRRYVGNQSL